MSGTFSCVLITFACLRTLLDGVLARNFGEIFFVLSTLTPANGLVDITNFLMVSGKKCLYAIWRDEKVPASFG